MSKKLKYVLVTPARNEEAYIQKTIQSVLSQTVRPRKWVIVSDGSTDRTDNIVGKFTKTIDWIELVLVPDRCERNFAGKVQAFKIGYERVKRLKYDLIGNLDADISFVDDFFEYLIDKFARIPRLGVAGTDYIEGNSHSFKDSYINMDHVNGQCQLFRRECFEEIGGYRPIRRGGIDWVAVTSARMKGWRTQSFSGRTFTHHRKMGTAGGSVLSARFHYGRKDYFLGGHPLWQIFRTGFQMIKKPYVVGGVFLGLGYLCSWIRREKRAVPGEIVKFHQREQMERLRKLFSNRLRLRR